MAWHGHMASIAWSMAGLFVAGAILISTLLILGTMRDMQADLRAANDTIVELQDEIGVLRSQVVRLETQVRDLGGDPITGNGTS